MINKSVIFLVSGDRNSKKLSLMFLSQFPRDSFYYVEDQSMDIRKIWNLLRKRRISIGWLAKQSYASLRQNAYLNNQKLSYSEIEPDIVIKTHKELLSFVENCKEANTIFAYRAGVILQKSLISKVRCINTHYASLPDYGGLGAIAKALNERAFHQNATIHEMETTIDSGQILLTEPYILDPSLPYWKNELNAALAGTRAAEKFVKLNYFNSI